MAFQRNSTIRQAFIDCKVNLNKPVPSFMPKILDSIERKVGLIRERGWNLNASRKTIEEVNRQTELQLKATS